MDGEGEREKKGRLKVKMNGWREGEGKIDTMIKKEEKLMETGRWESRR